MILGLSDIGMPVTETWVRFCDQPNDDNGTSAPVRAFITYAWVNGCGTVNVSWHLLDAGGVRGSWFPN